MTGKEKRRALVVTLTDTSDELISLLDTLGYSVAYVFRQKLDRPDPHTYVGSGKADEIRSFIDLCMKDKDKNKVIDIVIVNDVLRPAQHYNLEQLFNKEVYDRTRVILEIFKTRAHSREASLQVELARYQYELPFVREWVHRSKSGEHPGYLAGGEYKTDQYIEYIRKRISRINRDIDLISRQKEMRRQRRKESGALTVSIAGYANSGKSSLLNALTNAGVETADEYFTTLDTTTRQLPEKNQNILITDTIGLIRDTPPWMVLAFRSTLDEVRDSDVILILLDAADASNIIIEKYKLSETMLRDTENILAPIQKIIPVLNKIDKITQSELKERVEILEQYAKITPHQISALNKTGLNELVNKLKSLLKTKQISSNLHEK
jgi:GTP-binding protein HflX